MLLRVVLSLTIVLITRSAFAVHPAAIGPTIVARGDGGLLRAYVVFDRDGSDTEGYGAYSVVVERWTVGPPARRCLERSEVTLGSGFTKPLLVKRVRLLRSSRRQLFVRFHHNRETAAVLDLTPRGLRVLYHTYGPQQVRLRSGCGRWYLLEVWPAQYVDNSPRVARSARKARVFRRVYLSGKEDVNP